MRCTAAHIRVRVLWWTCRPEPTAGGTAGTGAAPPEIPVQPAKRLRAASLRGSAAAAASASVASASAAPVPPSVPSAGLSSSGAVVAAAAAPGSALVAVDAVKTAALPNSGDVVSSAVANTVPSSDAGPVTTAAAPGVAVSSNVSNSVLPTPPATPGATTVPSTALPSHPTASVAVSGKALSFVPDAGSVASAAVAVGGPPRPTAGPVQIVGPRNLPVPRPAVRPLVPRSGPGVAGVGVALRPPLSGVAPRPVAGPASGSAGGAVTSGTGAVAAVTTIAAAGRGALPLPRPVVTGTVVGVRPSIVAGGPRPVVPRAVTTLPGPGGVGVRPVLGAPRPVSTVASVPGRGMPPPRGGTVVGFGPLGATSAAAPGVKSVPVRFESVAATAAMGGVLGMIAAAPRIVPVGVSAAAVTMGASATATVTAAAAATATAVGTSSAAAITQAKNDCWVRCDKKKCMKWRRAPATVDVSKLNSQKWWVPSMCVYVPACVHLRVPRYGLCVRSGIAT